MASVIRTMRDAGVGADDVRAFSTWSSQSFWTTLKMWTRALLVIGVRSDKAVIHVHLSEGGSFLREGALLLLARLRRRPTVATLHGANFDEFRTGHPRLATSILRQADAVVCLVPSQVGAVRQLAPRSRVAYVPNPIVTDITPSAPSEQPPRVLFAGEISLRKGADVLERAWPTVHAAMPDAICLLVGPPTDLCITAQPGLEVSEPLPADRIRDLIRASRCVVLPSRAEAMPMFLLEAMASARPFVSTPVGAIAELRHGGILVAPGDHTQLAEAIIRLLTEPNTADELGFRGFESCVVERGTPVVSDALRDLYTSIS